MSSELILKYFPEITATQQQRFEQLLPLYQHWNSLINVVSRKDIDELYERHVLHSLGIAKVAQFVPETRILDVGTGGGFPGIPLAILFPEASFYLVDSIGKKIKVVQEVAQALQLSNITAAHTRAEQVEGRFDFVVSRAVTQLKDFYPWIKDKFNKQSHNDLPNGLLYLKGGDLAQEVAESGLQVKHYYLKDYFTEEFFDTKQVIYVEAK